APRRDALARPPLRLLDPGHAGDGRGPHPRRPPGGPPGRLLPRQLRARGRREREPRPAPHGAGAGGLAGRRRAGAGPPRRGPARGGPGPGADRAPRPGPDPHRARHRHLPPPRPPPVRPRHPGERLRGRDVEPAVPAGPGGARAGLRDLRLQALLPGVGAARGVRGHPAGHRAAGDRRDPGGVRRAGPRRAHRRAARRRQAAAQGSDHALAGEPGEPHGPAGRLHAPRRPLPPDRRDAGRDRRGERGRRGGGGGRVLRAGAADGGEARAVLIGVPKEIKPSENRVALVPAGAEALVAAGHEVLLERGAGLGSGFEDAQYAAVGARIVPDPDEVWRRAELIMKVKEPVEPEWPRLRPGQVVYTYFHFAANERLTRAVIASGAVAVAYETVQLPSGELPLLTPMSAVAGRMAVQAGATYLEKAHGGRGFLLGGVPG